MDMAMKDLEYVELMGGNREGNIKIVKSGNKNKQFYNVVEPIDKKVSDEGKRIVDSLENISAEKVEII